MKKGYFLKIKFSFLIYPFFIVLISIDCTASHSSDPGFNEFLEKTVGNTEKNPSAKSDNPYQFSPRSNEQSQDEGFRDDSEGYYNDQILPSPSNNASFSQVTRANPSDHKYSNKKQNSREDSALTESGFSQINTANDASSEAKSANSINTDVPVGVARFRALRDQNIYLDGVQDFVDGLVDKNGNPIEKSQVKIAQRPYSIFNRMQDLRHKKK